MDNSDWTEAFTPLLRKYKGKALQLHYKNWYQLLVMILLAARDSDQKINKVAPAFFARYPDLTSLSNAYAADVAVLLKSVRSSVKKSDWLLDIAKVLKYDRNIPTDMEGLVALKGIGRKSANVIMREAGVEAEGIIVDIHVMRVARRLGISDADTPAKMEQELMAILPQEIWDDIGMALTFLGVETCRPSNPKHDECVMNAVCGYCRLKREGIT